MRKQFHHGGTKNTEKAKKIEHEGYEGHEGSIADIESTFGASDSICDVLVPRISFTPSASFVFNPFLLFFSVFSVPPW